MIDARLSLITAPTVEPVTLDEAKEHCRVSSGSEDRLLNRLIRAARAEVEAKTQRALITQTHDWMLDQWPWYEYGGFELPRPPLQSVTWVKYKDANGDLQTWATTEYQISAPQGPYSDRGRMALVYGKWYPILRPLTFDAVQIRIVSGYGAAAANVPPDLCTAILFRVHEMFDHRAETTIGSRSPNVLASDALCAPYAVPRF